VGEHTHPRSCRAATVAAQYRAAIWSCVSQAWGHTGQLAATSPSCGDVDELDCVLAVVMTTPVRPCVHVIKVRVGHRETRDGFADPHHTPPDGAISLPFRSPVILSGANLRPLPGARSLP